MMKQYIKIPTGLAILTLFLLSLTTLGGIVLAQTSSNFNTIWNRLASGGNEGRQSENYMTQDIVGQWLSESPSSENAHIITNFFWADEESILQERTYLPIVIRTQGFVTTTISQ